MASQSFTFNGFETDLNGSVTDSQDTLPLVSANNLREPGYLVIDPESLTNREYIYFTTINGNTLEGVTRGLAGSISGGQAHNSAKVRAVSMHQMFDDLWEEVGDGVSDLTAHINDNGDPHAAAEYLKLAEANGLYVELIGDTMTGLLVLSGAPTADLHAATKLYVDDLIAGVDPAGVYLPLAGGTMTGQIIARGEGDPGIGFTWSGGTPFNLTSFANGDLEVRKGITTFLRFNHTANTIQSNQIFNMLTNRIANVGDQTGSTDAMNRQSSDARYVRLVGDTMTGVLNMGGFRVASVGDAAQPTDAMNRQTSDGRYLRLSGGTMTGDLDLGTVALDATGNMFFKNNGTESYQMRSDKFIPRGTTGTKNLGDTNNRWMQVFATTSENIGSRAATKDNIREAPDFGALIDRLDPIYWDRDERVTAGFTVEQFEAAGAVDGWTPASGDGLVYTELVVPLWQEVKALRARMAALEPA